MNSAMLRSRTFLLVLSLVALGILNIGIWMSLLRAQTPKLQVSILNVGQGDSILIEGPTGIDMLIDGGPDRSVLRQLPKELGFFDRTIDMVVETHPDKDHIAGLSDVFARYQVPYFLSPGIPSDSEPAMALTHEMENEDGLQSIIARRGMRIHLGDGAYADVLYPDHDVSQGETNDGSIVMRVVYGDTSFMLTGDAPSSVEDRLILMDAGKGDLASNVLKAGHHGSKYSSDALWLRTVKPSFVVISAGKGNSYGHPSPLVLDRVRNIGATILSTMDQNTIHFISDGVHVTHD